MISISPIIQLQTIIAVQRQIQRLITIQIVDLSYFSIVSLAEYQRDSVHDHTYTLIFGGSIVTVKSEKILLSRVITGKSKHFTVPQATKCCAKDNSIW